MSLVFFQGVLCAWGQVPSEQDSARRMVDSLLGKISNKTVSFEQLLPEIRQVENRTKNNIAYYLDSMRYITEQLVRRENPKTKEVIGEIIANAAFLTLDDETLNDVERVEALLDQLSMILMPELRPRKTEDMIDCDPKLRQKNANRLLELYQLFVNQVEENYDPTATENLPQFKHFVPPESYRGPMIGGMDYSEAEDEATRDAFKKYREEQWRKDHKYRAYETTKDFLPIYARGVIRYLTDAYSLFPYQTAELEQMLEEKKCDPEMSKTILDAVRKAENDAPDDGFRIWLSKDKLFKTTAKFISQDKGEVTLEKSDGKRTTIEFSALRKEDQDYVKMQHESEPKINKDTKNESLITK
jgi:hypothetical protein